MTDTTYVALVAAYCPRHHASRCDVPGCAHNADTRPRPTFVVHLGPGGIGRTARWSPDRGEAAA